MEDLITWLCGVLDDDETAAKAATPGPWGAQPGGQGTFDNEWEVVSDAHEHPHPGHYVVYTGYEGGGATTEQNALHIARHDPEQVLADIAAKRAILDLHDQSGVRWVGFPRADRQESYCVHDQQAAPCHTVRLLASGYRHRPGWRDSWGA